MKKSSVFLCLFFLIIIGRLFYINVIEGKSYSDLLDKKINNYVYGASAPRGRILDRNGVVLVDNIGVKTLFYNKLNEKIQKVNDITMKHLEKDEFWNNFEIIL